MNPFNSEVPSELRPADSFQIDNHDNFGVPRVETQRDYQSISKVVKDILNDLPKQNIPVASKETVLAPRQCISSLNTTIIGDYIVAGFLQYDAKWLVQATGNATFQSVLMQIKLGVVNVQRRYIFILLGHNQLCTVKKSWVKDMVRQFVVHIRSMNTVSKIFFVALLPRLVDNDTAKPKLIKFNRCLAAAVTAVALDYDRVSFIPVQHEFHHNSLPLKNLYNPDGFTLSHAGLVLLKKKLFHFAGFKKNDV